MNGRVSWLLDGILLMDGGVCCVNALWVLALSLAWLFLCRFEIVFAVLGENPSRLMHVLSFARMSSCGESKPLIDNPFRLGGASPLNRLAQ